MAGREEGPAIGIDLGTTYSCVAVWQKGKVDVIVNGQGNRTTPSYVAFAGSDRLVGEAAFSQSACNPSNTIYDAKRLIGRTFSDPMVQSDITGWPFEVIDDDGDRPTIRVLFEDQERRFYAEDISSMVLLSMKEMAENQLGMSINNVVITVPAHFNNAQREATKDAGAAAGLNVLRIVNEPTAAAMAYALDRSYVDPFLLASTSKSTSVLLVLTTTHSRKSQQRGGGGRTILVFDLGGGTFDVSLLTIDGSELKVISTAGDSHLGGVDFDQRLVEFCCEEMERKHGVDVRGNRRALRRLRIKCEEAKRVLSFMVETTIEAENLHGEVDFQCTVTAARFEDLNMDLFKRCLELTEACLKDSNFDKEAVDDVVLVGGSTRIPKVQELIKELFHGKTKISKELNPDEAVAVGAAVHAAMLGGDDTQFVDHLFLRDVTPLSLGINSADGLMSVIVPRNTPIPVKAKRLFSTSFDNQKSIQILVYEGERSLATRNNFLGCFVLPHIPPALTGVPRILVYFEIDEDGILRVSAENKQTKEKKRIKISSYGIATRNRQEIWRMVMDGRRHKIEDEEIRRKHTRLLNIRGEASKVEIPQENRDGGEASREASEMKIPQDEVTNGGSMVEIQQDEATGEASKVKIPRDEGSMEEQAGPSRWERLLGFLCLIKCLLEFLLGFKKHR